MNCTAYAVRQLGCMRRPVSEGEGVSWGRNPGLRPRGSIACQGWEGLGTTEASIPNVRDAHT